MQTFLPHLNPKIVTVLREGYSPRAFARDALAGVVVGIVALPLAIAFAIASGVRPEQGLYTAIVGGFIISVLGGSRVQIGGPTGAFVVIVASIVAQFGYEGLALATMMAGVMLVVMAIAGLGDVIRFVPYPVVVGFTAGIALIIALGQIRDGLGLPIDHVPSEFWERCLAYAAHIRSANLTAAALCGATILVVQMWPRITRHVPGPLVALLLTTVVVHAFGLRVDTIGSRFGSVPTTLPVPRMPAIDFSLIPRLSSPAISIALLAAIESLLSALVADGLVGGRHRSNAELMGQGVANIVSPLFGGIPATGAIARTATNIKNGGRTPFAGIVHAATLLIILLAAGRWAVLIPMPALAGILLVVAYNMSEWRVSLRLLRGPRSDTLVLVTTFLLTVVVDLTVALQVGIVLAALLFMRRMSEVTQVKALREAIDYEGLGESAESMPPVPPNVEVFEINGSFCFGAARKFTETLVATRSRPRVVILRMRHVLAMDATGLHALEDVASRLARQGTVLLLSGVHAQPLVAMQRSGTVERIGLGSMFATFDAALTRAREIAEDGDAPESDGEAATTEGNGAN